MNINKFLTKAKESGLEIAQIIVSKEESTSVSIFRGEIDSNEFSSSSTLSAKGIYNGKVGAVSSEDLNDSSIDLLIDSIKTNATLIEKEEKPIIFEGSKEYKKKNQYNKELSNLKTSDVLLLLFEIEKKIKEKDELVTDVEIAFAKSQTENELANTYGLDLKIKKNYFVIYANVYMKKDDVVKDNLNIVFGNKFNVNVDEFVEKTVAKCKEKFETTPIETNTYNAVIDSKCISNLIMALISNASSEQTQKHSSIFENKEGEKLFSSKLTVQELPLKNNIFREYYDDEGVACHDKTIIEKGVLKTLVYNLETAAKANKESTGNAVGVSKVGIGFNNITVKKGRLSLDQLFEKIKDGIYITSIEGLHAGLDSRSGDFSLQAEGFKVENGKRSSFLPLFTVSGNLFKLFKDIIAVGNDTKLFLSSTETPSIAFKNIRISA